MFDLGRITVRHCGGASRREVLQMGAAGALGLALPAALRAQEKGSGRDLSVIVVFLRGGVSHIDTWDMKPEAPRSDVRGEFKAIETNVPGIRMCELLPRRARQADKLTVIHGASHNQDEHDNAMQTVLSGSPPSAAGIIYPNMGAVLGRYNPGRTTLPPAIHVGTPGLGNPMAPPAEPEQRGLSAGFMGAAQNPFMVKDVERLGEMDWIRPANHVIPARLDRRRELVRTLDRAQRRVESAGADAHIAAYERAFAMVTSPEAKRAFNLDEEPPALRDRYGRHEFGQSCLLARRLIEAGVRYAQVNWSARGWDAITQKDDLFTRSTFDSHFGHFPWLRRQLPRLDPGLSSLLADLHDRGLLQRTLVVVLSEFGRAAGINADGGREHWPPAFSILMAGGGLPGGRVLGGTDSTGQEVTAGKFGPQALLNSVYQMCGLDVPVTLRQAGIVKDSSEGIPGLLG
jgi:hypothetical protein